MNKKTEGERGGIGACFVIPGWSLLLMERRKILRKKGKSKKEKATVDVSAGGQT